MNGSNTHIADNLHKDTNIAYFIRLSISLFIQFEITFSYLMIAVFNGWKFVQNRQWCEVLCKKKWEKKEFLFTFPGKWEVVMALNCSLLFAVISFILISVEFLSAHFAKSITIVESSQRRRRCETLWCENSRVSSRKLTRNKRFR